MHIIIEKSIVQQKVYDGTMGGGGGSLPMVKVQGGVVGMNRRLPAECRTNSSMKD